VSQEANRTVFPPRLVCPAGLLRRTIPECGPHQVISYAGEDYLIQDLVKMKSKTAHVSRVTPFQYDARFADPCQVANQEQVIYDVKKILFNRETLSKKSKLEFWIEWVNHSYSHDYTAHQVA
jgi:hypothetical protein